MGMRIRSKNNRQARKGVGVEWLEGSGQFRTGEKASQGQFLWCGTNGWANPPSATIWENLAHFAHCSSESQMQE